MAMRVTAALVLMILAAPETASVTPYAAGPREPGSGQADPAEKVKPDRFALLRAFKGRWRGEGSGVPGKSTVERTYEFVLRDRYLNVCNLSVYLPQKKNPKGEKHEDWGMFSYDATRKKLVLRQFHVEGFVNQYVLDRASDDGKELVFVSEAIENIPAGYRARETYRFTGADVFEETFELARPGKEFEVYVKTKFTRQK
jgi:hypothetical protein